MRKLNARAVLVGLFSVFLALPVFALPSGYTELEYIESTGTQFIDTGYKPNQNTTIEISYMKTDSGTGTAIVLGTTTSASATNANDGLVFLLNPNRVGFGKGEGTVLNLSNIGNVAGTRYTLRYDKNIVSWNSGNIKTVPIVSETWSAPNNLYLFGRNTAGSLTYRMTGRIYSYKAWNNGTLAQNFVPAKNSSNVIGMYDTVNNQFYTNAGSGTFTAGPVVTMKIATKKYNDTQFSPVKTRVNNVSSTLDNVVSTTLTQATTVNTLKNSKQNRPNSKCPTGKKCLLVRDVNGNDNWYEIVGADAAQ